MDDEEIITSSASPGDILEGEDEEIHLVQTCGGDSGFDDPHDHDLK